MQVLISGQTVPAAVMAAEADMVPAAKAPVEDEQQGHAISALLNK